MVSFELELVGKCGGGIDVYTRLFLSPSLSWNTGSEFVVMDYWDQLDTSNGVCTRVNVDTFSGISGEDVFAMELVTRPSTASSSSWLNVDRAWVEMLFYKMIEQSPGLHVLSTRVRWRVKETQHHGRVR